MGFFFLQNVTCYGGLEPNQVQMCESHCASLNIHIQGYTYTVPVKHMNGCVSKPLAGTVHRLNVSIFSFTEFH